MKNSNIFKNIIENKTSSKIIYQNKNVTAFHDINPKAPVHILIVSNKLIKSSNDIDKKNIYILSDMFYIAITLAKQFKINETGYRLTINCNAHGGQEIPHLHMHLLGGKNLGRMLT